MYSCFYNMRFHFVYVLAGDYSVCMYAYVYLCVCAWLCEWALTWLCVYMYTYTRLCIQYWWSPPCGMYTWSQLSLRTTKQVKRLIQQPSTITCAVVSSRSYPFAQLSIHVYCTTVLFTWSSVLWPRKEWLSNNKTNNTNQERVHHKTKLASLQELHKQFH